MRRPRRFCPGVGGDICSICCGTERENTVRCPLACVYLQEAHAHERTAPPDPASIPNQDIRIRESFIAEHVDQLTAVSDVLIGAALNETGAIDNDVRDTLDALIRTYRTRQSGLYYDSRPENLVAARIVDRFNENLATVIKGLQTRGIPAPTDSDILIILVFLQRIELDHNNGRRLGRAFLDYMHRQIQEMTAAEAEPRLIHTV